MDALVEAEAAAVGAEGADPILNVKRWWEPQHPLPVLCHWMSPGETNRPDLCTVEDLIRIDVMVAVDPRANAGRDMVELESAAVKVRDILDRELYSRVPLDGTVEWARRLGMRTQIQEFGQLGVLCMVFPVELRVSHALEL